MSRLFSTLVGSVIEAWAELRIHKTRVLLSLIGVAVAVTAITTVVNQPLTGSPPVRRGRAPGSRRPR